MARLRSYISNTAWLMGDNLVNNIFNLLVFTVVARYLGPTDYGAFAYVFSLAQLFAVLGQMGLDGLLTRDLVDHPDDHARVLGTGGGLRFIGYFIGAVLFVAYGLLTPEHTTTERWLFISAFLFIVMTPGPMILDNWFRSRVEARYSSIARIFGNVAAGLFKMAFVVLGAGVVAIGFSQAAGVLLTFLISLPLFLYRGGPAPHRWVFDASHAKAMLSESWLVFIGSALAMIYLKIDQVMLHWWRGSEEVGLYAVASRMSEVFYFVPAALVSTLFPRLIQLRKQSGEQFDERFESLLSLLSLMGYAIMAGVFLLGPTLIVLAFGAKFAEAGPVLMVHVIAMPFIFMRFAFSRWMLVERYNVFSVVTQGGGAIANVVLNIVLIPRYGMMGSAIATAISYAAASYLTLALSAKTRPVFFMMSRALFMPWRSVAMVNNMRLGRAL